MREPSNEEKIRHFMKELGQRVRQPGRIYLTGGATAVVCHWRDSTIDIDLKPVPETDEIFQAIAALKNELDINIELACPDQFIPALLGWEDRCIFIEKQGPLEFFHYDPYAQALAKIERGHSQDLLDIQEMQSRGLIDPKTLWQFFLSIKPGLIRYPAVDPEAFEAKVKEAMKRDRS